MNDDFELELYRQSWEQSRHNEQLRGAYTTWITTIVGAILGLGLTLQQTDRLHWMFAIAVVLFFFGFLISLRTWMTTRRWLVTQLRIQRKRNLADYIAGRSVQGRRPWSSLFDVTESLVRFDVAYNALHAGATLVFSAAFLNVFSFSNGFKQPTWIEAMILAMMFLLICVLWFCFWRLVRPYEKEIRPENSKASS